jgi:WS/DGAT/MGAT family acyltransferase
MARQARSRRPYAYEWLSAEDRMFLSFERANAHMHVGAVLLFDAGPLARKGRGVDVRRIRDYIEARLAAIPRYRQRLHSSPIDRQPVWVDDDRFEVAAHVRHVRLAKADPQAFHRQVGRIVSQRLDRERPLWELWIVDGLGGGRFAIISKIHHCMVDGVAGADLLAVLLSLTADETAPRRSRWKPRPAPGGAALLRDRARWQWETGRAVVNELRRIARHPSAAVDWARQAASLWQAVGLGILPAPDSPLNRAIGSNRRFAWQVGDLDRVKAVRDRLGGTVNDVVLATVAGAVREFLRSRDPDSPLEDLRALVPVSTRTAADAHSLGNHVGAWIMPLPIAERDPLRRFSRIHDMTGALKDAREAFGARLLSETGGALLGAGVRLLEWLRPFNLVITNIPGPPVPLYLLGARLRQVYPLVPLFPNQGLGVAVFSYAGQLCWGFNADCHVVPDLEAFSVALDDAFAELTSASGAAPDRDGAQPPATALHRANA